MAKRFTETELWREDWFLSMPKEYMLLYFYVKDNCDHAGIWRPNIKIFEAITDSKITLDEFRDSVNGDKERIVVLENGRWLLTDFFKFQYGHTLNLKNKVHKSIYDIYTSLNVDFTLIRGVEFPQDQNEEDGGVKSEIRKDNFEVNQGVSSTSNIPFVEVKERVKDKDKDKDIDNNINDNLKYDKKEESKTANAVSSKDENDYIDQIIGIFSEEFEKSRGIGYLITAQGKERKAVGTLLKLHKGKSKETATAEETKEHFRLLFQKCLEIKDNWHSDKMSLMHIATNINELRKKINESNSSKSGVGNNKQFNQPKGVSGFEQFQQQISKCINE